MLSWDIETKREKVAEQHEAAKVYIRNRVAELALEDLTIIELEDELFGNESVFDILAVLDEEAKSPVTQWDTRTGELSTWMWEREGDGETATPFVVINESWEPIEALM